MRKILWMVGLFLNSFAAAQVSEGFDDGELHRQPTWNGDTLRFRVNTNKQLQSRPLSTADTAYVYGWSPRLLNTSWEFYAQTDFDPSSTNLFRFYIASGSQYLNHALTGFFVQVGENGAADQVKLFLQEDAKLTALIQSGPIARAKVDTFKVWCKVTLGGAGSWDLYYKLNFTDAWTHAGTAQYYPNFYTSYYGWSIRHTATRSDKFFFDDLSIQLYEPDTSGPVLMDLSLLSGKMLQLQFNEPIDSLKLASIELQLNESPIIATIKMGSTAREITCSLLQPLPIGENTWRIKGLYDSIGNFSVEWQVKNFEYYPQAKSNAGDVIMSEFLPDPSPSIGLPDVEFVELYNRSQKIINLDQWSLSDGTNTCHLSRKYLYPGELLILCRESDLDLFADFNSVYGISCWTSLNNSADSILLINELGERIDKVIYDLNSYKNNNKKAGGYSLERAVHYPFRPSFYTLMASNSEIGGTPGTLSPDALAEFLNFQLEEFYISDAHHIKLRFSHMPDTNFMQEKNSIQYDGIGFEQAMAVDVLYREYELYFTEAFEKGREYQFQFAVQSGFLKQGLQSEFLRISYNPPRSDYFVSINELMVDPYPAQGLPLAEYIELYNNEEEDANLINWKIKVDNTQYTIPTLQIPPKSHIILCVLDDSLFLSDYGVTRCVSKSFTLPNTGAQVQLINQQGRIMDSITYSLFHYQNNQKATGGFSLERIDPASRCNKINNWIASAAQQGGTPGRENAIVRLNTDSDPLRILRVRILNASELQIDFNKPLVALPLNPFQFYLISPNWQLIFAQQVQVYTPNNNSVNIRFSQAIPTNKYQLVAQSMAHCFGNDTNLFWDLRINQVRSDEIQLTFSELMPDPTPSLGLPETEFVELHYAGADTLFQINLGLVSGSDSIHFEMDTLKPDTYYTLVPAGYEEQWLSYLNVIALPEFPSLHNSKDSLKLFLRAGGTIDSIHYEIEEIHGWTEGRSIFKLKPGLCDGPLYWMASLQAEGGSPGLPSAVAEQALPDLVIGSVRMNEEYDKAFISFNSALDRSKIKVSIEQAANLLASEKIMDNILELHFREGLAPHAQWEINIEWSDCMGREFDTVLLLHHKAPFSAEPLSINEILFNPFPNGFDFVEIANHSEYPVDLQDCSIMACDSTATPFALSKESWLLQANSYVVLCSNPEALTQWYQVPYPSQVLRLKSLPSMPDEKGCLQLLRGIDVVDKFEYHENMHKTWYDEKEGRSLEKRHPNRATELAENWSSCSDNYGMATPTGKNSQYQEFVTAETLFSIPEPTIFAGSVGESSQLQIQYNVGASNVQTQVSIFNEQGKRVQLLLDGQTLVAEGNLFWDLGIEGSLAPEGIYFVVIHFKIENGAVQQLKFPVMVWHSR